MYLVSYCILIDFVSTQWLDIFRKSQVFIDELTIYCMQTEVLALEDK